MNRGVVWIFRLLLGSSVFPTQAISPQDFAFGLPVITSNDAAAYRFALPLAVYQGTYQQDLADIQLFNAQGVAVPFSLRRPAAQPAIHKAATVLPLFPLHKGSRVVIDGVRVTINSPQAAVNLQTQNGAAAETTNSQYILDGRVLDTAIAALRLGWPEAASEYSGRLRVEASDDLGSWRTVVAAAPIANLHANGQALIENRVTLAPTKAKFWRISWLAAAPTFELTSVAAEPADSPVAPVWATLEVTGAREPAKADEYVFDLDAHPPVLRINVLLPEANTAVDVALSSRRTPLGPWRPVTHAGFYRLKTPDGEQQNSPLDISVDGDRYWRARIISTGGLPQTPLRLHVEWIPNEVTFLAQGQGPFLLAYGNATATRAEADLSHLPTSLEIAPATVGSPRVLGGSARVAAKPPPFPWARTVLWSVLLFAVLFLAWIAYRMSKETGKNG